MKQKILFIKDVEKILGVNRKTLFYWEKMGKIPKTRRTKMGNYRYWNLSEVKKLMKKIGNPLTKKANQLMSQTIALDRVMAGHGDKDDMKQVKILMRGLNLRKGGRNDH